MASILAPDRSMIPTLDRSEVIKTVVKSGAELILTIPDAPPSASATSGGSGGATKRKEHGGIWLTNQRFIFVITPSSEIISVPLHSILSTKFEQPYFFGSNFLALEIQPAPDGGLTTGTQAELRFKELPMFEFVSKLEDARKTAILLRRQAREDEDTLPVYTSTSSTTIVTVPAEDPPGYEI